MKPAVNLRQIEAFYSVVRSGTVVGAAQMMSVTQPAISRSIALLELRIGYKLFERRGRRLIPTPEGEAFFREIEPIYGSLDRIAQTAQDIGQLRAGELRIATLPSLSLGVVPRAVAEFLKDRPKVKVFIQVLPSRQIADQIATRQFDVALVELPLSKASISIEPLDPVPICAVIPKDHALAEKNRISLADLDGERMILLSQHSYIRYQIEEAFTKLHISPNVVLETPNSLVACALVAAGAGISLISKVTALPFQSSEVVVIPIREQLASRCAVIFPYPGDRMKLAEAFAAQLRATMQNF
ncbi:LysR substrate-binding domain-containing protein [Pseudomonas sp. NFX5]|uniref:LysR substrate-binding domain-containing protein n=1 Tax=Pseudomonas sp. NFX5 TaxID=2816961 RepID=UPI003B8D11E4